MPTRFPVSSPRFFPAPLTFLAPWLAATALLVAGCGDDTTAPPPPSDGGGVVITPGFAAVIVRATKTFIAQVADQTDQSVTWRLARATPTPEGVDLGSVAPAGPASAVYTAPERVASEADYQIRLIAVSVADTTARDTALITVPRIMVALTPGSLASVPPGTLVPYAVSVLNTTETGLQFFVQGVRDGNADVGTMTRTGENTAVYQAPDAPFATSTVDLLIRSVDDTTRFSTGIVTVRRGYPVAVAKSDLSQYAPAWCPAANKVAYVQGPPWEVAVYDFGSLSEQTVTAFEWPDAAYDGKLSWSRDGSLLAFSQATSAGRRTIGVVSSAGGTPATFAPDAGTQYYEASFIPSRSSGPESLVVAQESGGGGWSLRAYPTAAAAGDPGRLLYAAGGGRTLRWPDAVARGGTSDLKALYVAVEESEGAWSEVLLLVVDGAGEPPAVVTSGSGRRTQVRWAEQLGTTIGALPWITYIWDGNHTTYRAAAQAAATPVRLYSEFFPELGGDLALWPSSQQLFDAHVLSRRQPDGMARLWVVEFPPRGFRGVPKAEELELASIGVRGTLAPSAWGRWLGGYEPTIGLRPGETLQRTAAGAFAPRRSAR